MRLSTYSLPSSSPPLPLPPSLLPSLLPSLPSLTPSPVPPSLVLGGVSYVSQHATKYILCPFLPLPPPPLPTSLPSSPSLPPLLVLCGVSYVSQQRDSRWAAIRAHQLKVVADKVLGSHVPLALSLH